MYYPCSENKGADQLRRVFVFAYADYWFSDEAAHLLDSLSGNVNAIKSKVMVFRPSWQLGQDRF